MHTVALVQVYISTPSSCSCGCCRDIDSVV